MKIIECVQGSPEWFAARCGIPTASNFDKIVDSSGKASKQRTKYLYQLAGERITGKSEETYKNAAMTRGTEMEGEARSFYELMTGKNIEVVGFCSTEGKSIYGASPDGLVGHDGGIEIKCPLISTHVGYLLAGTLPTDYFQQVQGGLLVTARKWCDFISYYPGMKPLVVRVQPDKEFECKLSVELELFCDELDAIVQKIK